MALIDARTTHSGRSIQDHIREKEMEPENVDRRPEAVKPDRPNVIVANELAQRIRWNRYILAAAASNPYLERPAYAA
jgi:hypothetical protein